MEESGRVITKTSDTSVVSKHTKKDSRERFLGIFFYQEAGPCIYFFPVRRLPGVSDFVMSEIYATVDTVVRKQIAEGYRGEKSPWLLSKMVQQSRMEPLVVQLQWMYSD